MLQRPCSAVTLVIQCELMVHKFALLIRPTAVMVHSMMCKSGMDNYAVVTAVRQQWGLLATTLSVSPTTATILKGRQANEGPHQVKRK